MNTTTRAVLWDVDGTLVDSAEYHWLTWHEALAREHYKLTHERFEAYFGQRNDTILRAYFGADFPAQEIERISAMKETLYRAMIHTRGIEPLPGVRHWLARLQADGWRQCIASSAPRANIDAITSALDIGAYFAAVASAEEVERGKPHPDIFLAAARKVAVPPARCVVVEDAPAGLAGARRAGCHTIGVLSTHAALDADIVVETLTDLRVDAFDQLVPAVG
jgi:HAD superfamily hydrolase (TIGR01509 family)